MGGATGPGPRRVTGYDSHSVGDERNKPPHPRETYRNLNLAQRHEGGDWRCGAGKRVSAGGVCGCILGRAIGFTVGSPTFSDHGHIHTLLLMRMSASVVAAEYPAQDHLRVSSNHPRDWGRLTRLMSMISSGLGHPN